MDTNVDRKMEIVSLFYLIRKTCEEAESCFKCPFHVRDKDVMNACIMMYDTPEVWSDKDIDIIRKNFEREEIKSSERNT